MKSVKLFIYLDKEKNMQHMQEDVFDKLEKSRDKCPPHEVVKLYSEGTHTDYGCIKCKLKSLIIKDFEGLGQALRS